MVRHSGRSIVGKIINTSPGAFTQKSTLPPPPLIPNTYQAAATLFSPSLPPPSFPCLFSICGFSFARTARGGGGRRERDQLCPFKEGVGFFLAPPFWKGGGLQESPSSPPTDVAFSFLPKTNKGEGGVNDLNTSGGRQEG